MQKRKDDKINNKTFYDLDGKKRFNKIDERNSANIVPFYERLRYKDQILEKSLRDEGIKNLEIKQHKAAYVNGHCITNSTRLEDYAKLDAIQAEREAKDRYAKYDENKKRIENLKKEQMLKASKENYERICKQE